MTYELQFKSILFCTFVLFCGHRVHAQQSVPKKTPTESWEQRAIDSNIRVSRWFDSVAEQIDLFIAGRRVTTRRNDTSLRIENSSIYREGIGYANATAFNINLRLPNVEEYWSLKFTSYDEEEERRSSESAQYRQRPRARNYGATIGFFRRLGSIRAAFQPRIELTDPLKVSHSITLDTTIDMNDRTQMFPKVELFASSDRGTGVFNQLNFGYQLNDIYGLSLVNQSTYQDKTRTFLVANGISIGRQVIKTGGISYSLFFNSSSQPTYNLESYSIAATWTHLLYNKILDYNVTPHVDFARSICFTGRFGLNFNVNLQF